MCVCVCVCVCVRACVCVCVCVCVCSDESPHASLLSIERFSLIKEVGINKVVSDLPTHKLYFSRMGFTTSRFVKFVSTVLSYICQSREDAFISVFI